jgi:hypothetical protein
LVEQAIQKRPRIVRQDVVGVDEPVESINLHKRCDFDGFAAPFSDHPILVGPQLTSGMSCVVKDPKPEL